LISGIGTDIIEIHRVQKILQEKRAQFSAKFFTDKEIEYCEARNNPYPHYAVRFAAKEAAVKALGTGFRQMKFKDIEVINDDLGAPAIKLSGRALAMAYEKGIKEIKISLSHCENYALAYAIAVI